MQEQIKANILSTKPLKVTYKICLSLFVAIVHKAIFYICTNLWKSVVWKKFFVFVLQNGISKLNALYEDHKHIHTRNVKLLKIVYVAKFWYFL